MTTITNFLESSFMDQAASSEKQALENPIWVLNVPTHSLQQKTLSEYMISHSSTCMKPLIHLDLGISLIKKYPSSKFKSIELENGLLLIHPKANAPYFVIRSAVRQRSKPGYLPNLIKKLKELNTSKTMRQILVDLKVPNKYTKSLSLIVQGLQTMLALDRGNEVESFISQLSSLNSSHVKQISIICLVELLSEELRFSLERISTCLTTLLLFDPVSTTWECESTVRRYTGYSKQESYLIVLNKTANRIKVSKKTNKLNLGQETEEQKEIMGSLGFAVKKDKAIKQRQKQLQSMIYPHLNRRKECSCVNKEGGCKCGCAGQYQGEETKDPTKEKDLDDLFVLDQEQEDEDDVDV